MKRCTERIALDDLRLSIRGAEAEHDGGAINRGG